MGLPWLPVLTTIFIGLISTTCFLWKSILIVRDREYLVEEREIKSHLDKVVKEKTDILKKIDDLNRQREELRKQQKLSKQSTNTALEKAKELEATLNEVEVSNLRLCEENNSLMQLFDRERTKYLNNMSKAADLEKVISKLHRSLKKTQEALSKSKVLMDESKIREDARNAQHQSLQKDCTLLKEKNRVLKKTAKDLEDRNSQLCEEKKLLLKSQKEYEDTIAQKDHSNEVLTELLVDLEAFDLQKTDKAVANGAAGPDRSTAVKTRISQLMDVSRVQTTLSIVAEERDKFQTKLQSEEKARKSLEEKYQELEHNTTVLKSEKSLIENQFKILQQKNEIMTEMYQQKEIALQKRLTTEELERRDKEMKLSAVDGKALEAEQELKIYRQRVKEMEEEVKKTEKALKVQIAEQERKAHENWVAANTAERSLSQEKTLTRSLREKLAALSNQLNDFRASSCGYSAVRRGDSYGPSPVSGGAPSPPLMIEGPGRPLSAPIGRRIDPYGPRAPFEKHTVPTRSDAAPLTSSPTNTEDPNSRHQGPGSFLESPIRDCPGPHSHGPPPGPHSHGPPPGPHSHGPPLGPRGAPPPAFGHGYRPPPPSHLPLGTRQANGNEGLPAAEFRYRPPLPPNGPPAMMGPRPGLPPGPGGMRFPPSLPHLQGPAYRGGPPRPYAPHLQDLRFNGPREYAFPPHPPPGALPPPPQGALPSHNHRPPGSQAPQDSCVGPPGQDSISQQAAGQDSARSAMLEP